MPIYNYECKSCGIEFEYFIVRSDDKPECPKCENKEEMLLEKKVSKNVTGVINGASARNSYGLKPRG